MKIKFLRSIIAGGKPREIGETAEIEDREAVTLIASQLAVSDEKKADNKAEKEGHETADLPKAENAAKKLTKK